MTSISPVESLCEKGFWPEFLSRPYISMNVWKFFANSLKRRSWPSFARAACRHVLHWDESIFSSPTLWKSLTTHFLFELLSFSESAENAVLDVWRLLHKMYSKRCSNVTPIIDEWDSWGRSCQAGISLSFEAKDFVTIFDLKGRSNSRFSECIQTFITKMKGQSTFVLGRHFSPNKQA